MITLIVLIFQSYTFFFPEYLFKTKARGPLSLQSPLFPYSFFDLEYYEKTLYHHNDFFLSSPSWHWELCKGCDFGADGVRSRVDCLGGSVTSSVGDAWEYLPFRVTAQFGHRLGNGQPLWFPTPIPEALRVRLTPFIPATVRWGRRSSPILQISKQTEGGYMSLSRLYH